MLHKTTELIVKNDFPYVPAFLWVLRNYSESYHVFLKKKYLESSMWNSAK